MHFTQGELNDLCRAVGSKVNDTKRCLKRAIAKGNGPLINGLQKQLRGWERLFARVKEESPGIECAVFKEVSVVHETRDSHSGKSTFDLVIEQEDERCGRRPSSAYGV